MNPPACPFPTHFGYADLVRRVEAAERRFFLTFPGTGRIRAYIPGEFGTGWDDFNIVATLVCFNAGAVSRFPLSRAELVEATDRRNSRTH